MIFRFFNNIETESEMSELAILLARVLTSLSKFLLKVSESFSLLLIVLLLLFKMIDLLRYVFSEKRGPTVFKDFRRQLYGLVSKNTSFSFAKQASINIFWQFTEIQ